MSRANPKPIWEANPWHILIWLVYCIGSGILLAILIPHGLGPVTLS